MAASGGDAANVDTSLSFSCSFPSSLSDLACIMYSDVETEETAGLSVLR